MKAFPKFTISSAEFHQSQAFDGEVTLSFEDSQRILEKFGLIVSSRPTNTTREALSYEEQLQCEVPPKSKYSSRFLV